MDLLSEKQFEARQAIINAASRNELTPDEAERLAEEQGLGPLAVKPDKSKFDPLTTSRWSLPMTLAWIMWRDIDAVREEMNEYLREFLDWRFRRHKVPVNGGQSWQIIEGWYLESLGNSSIFKVRMSEVGPSHTSQARPHKTFSEARGLLHSALQDGFISAEARNSEGAIVIIPEIEWPALRFEDDGNKPNQPIVCFGHNRWRPAYYEIRFKRSAILEQWQTLVDPGNSRRARRFMKDADAMALIRAEAEGNDGFISLQLGAEILRQRDPGIKRDDARQIVKAVIGNVNPGPKGPRKKPAK